MKARGGIASGGRLVVTIVVAFMIAFMIAFVIAFGFGAVARAGAQSSPPPTTTTLDPDRIGSGALGDIVPEPGSGREPTVEGERGTRSQLIAFFALFGGLALIGSLAARDVRRARARRGAQDAATSTRSDPVADTSENPPSSSARQ